MLKLSNSQYINTDFIASAEMLRNDQLHVTMSDGTDVYYYIPYDVERLLSFINAASDETDVLLSSIKPGGDA